MCLAEAEAADVCTRIPFAPVHSIIIMWLVRCLYKRLSEPPVQWYVDGGRNVIEMALRNRLTARAGRANCSLCNAKMPLSSCAYGKGYDNYQASFNAVGHIVGRLSLSRSVGKNRTGSRAVYRRQPLRLFVHRSSDFEIAPWITLEAACIKLSPNCVIYREAN